MSEYKTYVVERDIKTTVRMIMRIEVPAKDEDDAKEVARKYAEAEQGNWKAIHNEVFYLEEDYSVLGIK